MKRKDKKAKLISRLSTSLQRFYPELADHFLCPTCLKTVAVSEVDQISEAHIVPRSAGGRLSTLICTPCNSTFGHSQDKWLGEFVRLAHARESVLQTRHQKGHFLIGGQRVGGRFKASPEDGFEFFIDARHTSPAALAEVQCQAAKNSIKEITIPLPILENRQLVDFGLITSAYLLWFRELGYSWALQRHLDPIRELILNPRTAAVPRNYGVVLKKRVFDSPWIGVGVVGEELCLLTGLANRLVFFPPADRHDLYVRLPTDFTGMVLSRYQVLRFYDHHQFGGPLGVIYHDRTIVCPDVVLTRAAESRFWAFPTDGSEPRMLYPITKEEFDLQQGLPDAAILKVKPGLKLPPSEIGRHG